MRHAVVVGVLLACACGKGSSASDGGSDGGGVADDLSVAGPLLEPNPPKSGVLQLQSYFFTGFADAKAYAAFGTYGGSALGPCSATPVAGCRLRSCPRDADMGGGIALPPMRTFVGAGTVTLTGPAGVVPMPVASDGSYGASLGMAKPWNGGESFTIAATGDVVPAFALALIAPSRPRILSPPRPPPSGGSVTVSRAAGLPVTWTPTTPGTLSILLSGDMPDAFLFLSCDVPTSAGSYTVPPEALAAIPLAALNPTVSADVHTSATAMAGDWPITFTADTPPNDDAQDMPWIAGISWQ